MPTFWRETDVAVMPSVLPESFGIAALEAMASGKPVVATDNGGIVEVVEDGVTGRLVPVGSVDAISDALLGYLRDPPLRESHGLAGRRRAEALFSMSRCAEEYARLLEAMNNPGPARVDAGR